MIDIAAIAETNNMLRNMKIKITNEQKIIKSGWMTEVLTALDLVKTLAKISPPALREKFE